MRLRQVPGHESPSRRDERGPVAPEAHAVLVLDDAGWHGARALKVPDNIKVLDNTTLLALP